MVRLAISVEGKTEQQFVETILKPHLINVNKSLTCVIPISIDKVNHELNTLIGSFDYVTIFYDFYGFKYKPEGATKKNLEDEILKNKKIIPYIQMYEFEVLLFSSPQIMGKTISCKKTGTFDKILKKANNNPEKINNSYNTTPKHRIEQASNYNFIIVACTVLFDIGLDEVRKKCNGFNEWLTNLESLASTP